MLCEWVEECSAVYGAAAFFAFYSDTDLSILSLVAPHVKLIYLYLLMCETMPDRRDYTKQSDFPFTFLSIQVWVDLTFFFCDFVDISECRLVTRRKSAYVLPETKPHSSECVCSELASRIILSRISLYHRDMKKDWFTWLKGRNSPLSGEVAAEWAARLSCFDPQSPAAFSSNTTCPGDI